MDYCSLNVTAVSIVVELDYGIQNNQFGYIMRKVIVRTGEVSDFFERAKQAARRADAGLPAEGSMTLSFEDPQRMFTVLSQARRELMLEIMREPKTIQQLADDLHRNRSTITKDVGLLEKMGLIVSQRQPNPGHGIQKLVRAVAPRIELVSALG